MLRAFGLLYTRVHDLLTQVRVSIASMSIEGGERAQRK